MVEMDSFIPGFRLEQNCHKTKLKGRTQESCLMRNGREGGGHGPGKVKIGGKRTGHEKCLQISKCLPCKKKADLLRVTSEGNKDQWVQTLGNKSAVRRTLHEELETSQFPQNAVYSCIFSFTVLGSGIQGTWPPRSLTGFTKCGRDWRLPI